MQLAGLGVDSVRLPAVAHEVEDAVREHRLKLDQALPLGEPPLDPERWLEVRVEEPRSVRREAVDRPLEGLGLRLLLGRRRLRLGLERGVRVRVVALLLEEQEVGADGARRQQQHEAARDERPARPPPADRGDEFVGHERPRR
jgi:hypothetical protein